MKQSEKLELAKKKKEEKLALEIERLSKMYETENELHKKGYSYVCGLDEVGRGPLAGPVVAGACILTPDTVLMGLNDSKKVTEKNRERLSDEIKEKALGWGIGEASMEEIDELNILNATKVAMKRAIFQAEMMLVERNENAKIDFLVLDALTLDLNIPQSGIIKGDAKVACISAASILAKVYRDNLMVAMDSKYPGYGFASHKGYGTKAHMDFIMENGPCEIHRKSFLNFYYNKK